MRVEGSGGRVECGCVWKPAGHDWRCEDCLRRYPERGITSLAVSITLYLVISQSTPLLGARFNHIFSRSRR